MSETEQVTGAPVEASPLPTFAEQAKAALGGEASSAPVVPAVPEAAPAVPAVPEAPAKSRVFAQYFQEHYGADLGGVSDEELAPQIGQILEGNQILEQRLAERERQLNEFLASQSEFEEFRRSKAQANVASQEQKPPQEPKLKPLSYDPEWEHLATQDKDTGLWTPKTRYGMAAIEAAEKLNQYHRELADRGRRLMTDPLSLIQDAGLSLELERIREEYRTQLEALKKEMTEAVNSVPQRLRQEAEQAQVMTRMESWVQEREKDLFQCDAGGRPLMRGGQMVLSDRGQVYQQAAKQAKDQFGLSDPHKIHAFASQIYEARFANPVVAAAPQQPVAPPAPQPTASEINAEQKRKFLEKGQPPASVPTNRDGAHLAAAKDGRPGMFLHRFREQVLTDPDNAEVLGSNFKG